MEANLLIERVAFGGAGIGRLPDGRICFVPGTLPGERVDICVVKQKKSYAEAELVRLVEASVQRVKPPCPVFGTCGGCAYQHAAYPLQLEIKTAQVRETLVRIGGLTSPDVRPTLASPLEFGYRNRISVHVDDAGRVGFHRVKSRDIVAITRCPISSPGVNEQLAALASRPPHRAGRITLRDETTYRGFSQVNEAAAQVLSDVVDGFVPETTAHLVDAYCGAGFFLKRLRSRIPRTTGIEWSHGAVAAALADLAPGEAYLEGPVESHLRSVLTSTTLAETVLLVDPPAEGLSDDVLGLIEENPVGRLIYVSCDPSTLARDIRRLSSCYVPSVFQPVDMFPQTAEIEVAAALVRR